MYISGIFQEKKLIRKKNHELFKFLVHELYIHLQEAQKKPSQEIKVKHFTARLELHGIGPNVDDVELDLRGLRRFCCLAGELSLDLRGNQVVALELEKSF